MEDMKIRKSNRDQKVVARRNRMPVNGRSVFVIQDVIVRKAKEAKEKRNARRS